MIYLFDEYELDEENFSLSRHGQRVPLEPKSLRVLLLLVDNRGKLVEKSVILETVWNKTFVEDSTLTRTVALLRKQLGDDSRSPKFIETVPTLGYRFIANVEMGRAEVHSSTATPTSTPAGSRSLPTRFRLAVLAAAVGLALVLSLRFIRSRSTGPLESQQVTFSADPKEGPLFTDGSRLFLESRGEPVETPVGGGTMAPMPFLEPGMSLLDITADGSKALVLRIDLRDTSGRGTLWEIPIPGGTLRKISDHLAACARWSANGHSVIFSDQRALYSIDADGTNERKLWDPPGYIFQVSVSPDATQISATLGLPGIPRLWMVQSDGKNPHALLVDWPVNATQESGQWTPDGRHFFFTSDREGVANVYDLLVPRWFEFWRRPSAVRLTGNQLWSVASAASPDSKTLFVLGRLERGSMRELDPSLERFVPCCGDLSASEFLVSPDRQWMVYREYPSSNLWRSRVDGTERLQLTHSFSVMEQWSPDSKWLAYSADYHTLYRVSLDGGSPERLLQQQGAGYEVSPSWSADGKSIAFHYFPEPDKLSKGIQILDLTSRRVSLMPGTEGLYYPSWSPDGKSMVAISQNPSQMMLYSAETRIWKPLHRFEAPWGNWAWSTDSKSIYMALVSGQNGLYRLTVPEGSWKKVNDFEGINLPPMAMANSFVSITPKGRLALMSDTSIAQVYSLRWTR